MELYQRRSMTTASAEVLALYLGRYNDDASVELDRWRNHESTKTGVRPAAASAAAHECDQQGAAQQRIARGVRLIM